MPLGLVGIAVGCATFAATIWFLAEAPRETTTSIGRKPQIEIVMRPGMLAPATIGTITPAPDGLAIAWQRKTNAPQNALDGIFMHTVSGEPLAQSSGRRIQIEFDVTANASKDPLVLEAQFIQNDLKMGGWEKFALSPGRQVHVLNYDAPEDTRTGERLATIWLRPDVSGLGRPIIIHAIRLYVQ